MCYPQSLKEGKALFLDFFEHIEVDMLCLLKSVNIEPLGSVLFRGILFCLCICVAEYHLLKLTTDILRFSIHVLFFVNVM